MIGLEGQAAQVPVELTGAGGTCISWQYCSRGARQRMGYICLHREWQGCERLLGTRSQASSNQPAPASADFPWALSWGRLPSLAPRTQLVGALSRPPGPSSHPRSQATQRRAAWEVLQALPDPCHAGKSVEAPGMGGLPLSSATPEVGGHIRPLGTECPAQWEPSGACF